MSSLLVMLGVEKLDEADLQTTWDDYFDTRSLEARNKLVVHFTASLVRGVVVRVASHLPVEREELISFGVIGLMDAIEKFNRDRGVKFETYAATRIRGSILDSVRSLDWAPRTMRARARAVEAAQDELSNDLGRMPTQAELAEHLGIALEDLHALKNEVNSSSVTSLDLDPQSPGACHTRLVDRTTNPATTFETGEITELMAGAINKLPRRSRVILALYYLHGMTLSEIGVILGVTESRVCQLQSRLLQSLQSHLSGEPVAA